MVLGSGLGGVAELLDPSPARADRVRRAPARADLVGRRPRGRAAGRHGARHAGRAAVGTCPPIRGPLAARVDPAPARGPCPWAAHVRPHQCRRRPEPGLRPRRRHAHHRPHQPVGRQSAARSEPRSLRRALPGHDRCLRPRAVRRGAGVGRADRHRAARGGLHHAPRTVVRDASGDADAPRARGRRGRHEHRPRDDRRPPRRRARARPQPHHQQGHRGRRGGRDPRGGHRDGPHRCRATGDAAG